MLKNNHFIILKADGTVWTVGNNEFGQLGTGSTVDLQEPVLVSDLSGIAHIGAGERHSFAIDSAGRLYAWGNNSSGQLGTGNINTELTSDDKYIIRYFCGWRCCALNFLKR